MYNRSKKVKCETKDSKLNHGKAKTIRHSALKTPKQPQTSNEHRSPQLSKFKSVPSKVKRQMATSLLPPDLHYSDHEPEVLYNAYKTNKTNTTTVDIPYSQSQKTINFNSSDKIHRTAYRHNHPGKKGKVKNHKYDLQFKFINKQTLTTRKSSVKKVNLDILFRKTDRILKKYQKRQEQWRKQRATLIEEIQDLKKRKHSGRTLTSSASSYMHKKQLS